MFIIVHNARMERLSPCQNADSRLFLLLSIHASTLKSEAVICSNPEGWVYLWACFVCFPLLLRQPRYGVKTLIRDVFDGIELDLYAQVKFSAFQKFGGIQL
ncbi:hypothetical protein Pfo_018579 [Paulownia fortunei]|nr:hypothetical protein Pfo_018579 [Paulownia fortunei]